MYEDRIYEQHSSSHTKATELLSHLTVRLLVARAGTGTTELLGLTATGVDGEEVAVVGGEDVLHLLLGSLIDELLVVSNQSLGDGLADGVDLGSETTTLDTDANVDLAVALNAEEEDRLENLEAVSLVGNGLNGSTIDLDETVASLAMSNGNGGFLHKKVTNNK